VPALIEAHEVKMYFKPSGIMAGSAPIRAVDGVSLSIARGETLALVGESGSGKSTLGRVLLRLYQPTAGRVIFDGIDITRMPERKLRPLRRRMQLIPQDPYAAFNPRIRIGESVKEVLEVHGVARGEEAVEKVVALFERIGLVPGKEFYNRYPYQLSGGQLQRAAIARAMIVEPDFVVADEPTSSLDVSIRASIIELLEEFRKRIGQSLLFITHDLAVAKLIADRVAVMYLGKLVELGSTEAIMENPLHPYTRALIEAIPKLRIRARPKLRLKGEIPDPRHPPPGCRLHPRCPYATDRCRKEEPPLTEVEKGRLVACWLAARS